MTFHQTRNCSLLSAERVDEILRIVIEVLAADGYDRLTMGRVAERAMASKATLYRRWGTKVSLVLDAIGQYKLAHHEVADTGNLRSDLVATLCRPGGLTDPQAVAILTGLATAMHRDTALARAVRSIMVNSGQAGLRTIWQRANARGDVSQTSNFELLESVLGGLTISSALSGERCTEEIVKAAIDQIVLPVIAADLARARPPLA